MREIFNSSQIHGSFWKFAQVSLGSHLTMPIIDQFLPLWTILDRPEYDCGRVFVIQILKKLPFLLLRLVHAPGEWWTVNRGKKHLIFGWWCIGFGTISEVTQESRAD